MPEHHGLPVACGSTAVTRDGRYRLVTDGATVLAGAGGDRGRRPADDSACHRRQRRRYYTNNFDIMRLPELPGRLIIVGSGYIAAESAHVFGSLGSQVTVVARSGRLLRSQDEDISARFTEVVQQQWDVRLNGDVSDVEELPDGTVRVSFFLTVATVTATHCWWRSAVFPTETGWASTHRRRPRRRPVKSDDGAARRVCAEGGRSAMSRRISSNTSPITSSVVQGNLIKGWDATDPEPVRITGFVPGAVFTHPRSPSVGSDRTTSPHEAGYDITVNVQTYG